MKRRRAPSPVIRPETSRHLRALHHMVPQPLYKSLLYKITYRHISEPKGPFHRRLSISIYMGHLLLLLSEGARINIAPSMRGASLHMSLPGGLSTATCRAPAHIYVKLITYIEPSTDVVPPSRHTHTCTRVRTPNRNGSRGTGVGAGSCGERTRACVHTRTCIF